MAHDRRGLLKVLSGLLGGGAASLVALPALRVGLDPLGRTTVSAANPLVAVGRLEAVPPNGAPLKLPVTIDSPLDAWQRLPPTEVGSVYVRRDKEGVVAYSAICPHLGCGIAYVEESRRFACPCHESAFDLEGGVEGGPAPRPLDRLEARVTDGRVFVRYQRFKQGVKERIPIS